MAKETCFYYEQSYSFFFLGLGMFLLGFAALLCFVSFNYWLSPALEILFAVSVCFAILSCIYGFSMLWFFFSHIRKKTYITISDTDILIDAETNLKSADIAKAELKRLLGLEMLCFKVRNPKQYNFSWRFKADRIFHWDYQAFICPGLVNKCQREKLLEYFAKK